MERISYSERLTFEHRKRFELWNNNIYVYFIASNYHGRPAIKIGYSWDPLLRARDLRRTIRHQTEVLTAIRCKGEFAARELERQLHRQFKAHRIKGEWFEPHISILSLADEYARKEVRNG